VSLSKIGIGRGVVAIMACGAGRRRACGPAQEGPRATLLNVLDEIGKHGAGLRAATCGG
jgi:hypothetical protein